MSRWEGSLLENGRRASSRQGTSQLSIMMQELAMGWGALEKSGANTWDYAI